MEEKLDRIIELLEELNVNFKNNESSISTDEAIMFHNIYNSLGIDEPFDKFIHRIKKQQ